MKNKKLFYILVLAQNFFIILLTYKYILNNKTIYQQYFNNINFNFDYENNSFAIIRYPNCQTCGFFSYYIIYITCIKTSIIKGYIPIIDLETFPNIFNGFKSNSSKENPWEYFFHQPFGYTLKEVKQKSKNIYYFNCGVEPTRPRFLDIYSKKVAIDFWHNFAKKYIPIKKNLIKESNINRQKLFQNSNNILGVLIRGTDYISINPKGHPITPKAEMVIQDIIIMDKKYKYDWIFIATEDNIIRNKFIKEFGDKLKYLLPKENIQYNYSNKTFLSYNQGIKGNMENLKIYLINIIILSKCIDIITSRTNGSVGLFILTEGFRYNKVYYLGLYR